MNTLNSEQLKRSAHTVRGLSSNIGASALHSVTAKLDEIQSNELIAEFSRILTQVTSEIDEKLST